MTERTISYCVQRGNSVYVYDQRRVQVMAFFGELQGYTNTTVTVKKPAGIYVYDAYGKNIATHPAR